MVGGMMPPKIYAKELFSGLDESAGNIIVSSVEYDSRRVSAGSCFVAIKGFTVDGHDYITDAASKGASLIVAQANVQRTVSGVPVVAVSDSRDELARISDIFYGHPSAKLGVIGVTGTNGKTTVTYLLERILEDAGSNVTRIGTIEYRFPDRTEDSPNTTPESADLQKLFYMASRYKNPRCVIEASSHGLSLGRLNRMVFKGCVFTNLTQDHLDFHISMEEYEESKRKLFTDFDTEYSVINIDDAAGRRYFTSGLPGRVRTYGFSEDADYRIENESVSWEGNRYEISAPQGRYKVTSPLPGRHNLYNSTAAIAVGLEEGLSAEKVLASVEKMDRVPGRFETVPNEKGIAVVVDYAHTDNALSNVLATARDLTEGKVICVFGCGGDRDRKKRKLMGRVAWDMADVLVVTSDNPRTENPHSIIEEILEGIPEKNSGKVQVIESRRDAIKRAIEIAEKGDSVVIAGKGHETYQIIGRTRYDFDDRLVAAEYLGGGN